MENLKNKKLALILPMIAILAFFAISLSGCNEASSRLSWKTQFEKSTYYIGDTLDVSGGVVNYTNDEGDLVEVAVMPTDVTYFDTSSFGEKMMTISIGEETLNFSYTVKNLKLGSYQGSQRVVYNVATGRSTSYSISSMSLEFNSDGTCVVYEQGQPNTVAFDVYENGTMSILSSQSYHGFYSNNGLTLFISNEDVQETQTTLYFNFVG